MWQILLGTAAFAILQGCAGNQKPPPPKYPKNPKPPKPKYQTDFPPDHKAHWLYLNLKLKGVADADLDQGCPKLDLTLPPKTKVSFFGSQDYSISSCEVFEYTLNHQKAFPRLAEELTGSPLPWSLDDFDKQTHSDQKISGQISRILASLDAYLQSKHYKPDSAAYRERVALYLNALTNILPDTMPYDFLATQGPLFYSQKDQRFLKENFKKEFTRLDLTELWGGLLEKSSGLPFAAPEGTRSALQAIKTGHAGEWDRAKILFALFEKAKLDPFFILINPRNSTPSQFKKLLKINPNFFYMAVGIDLGKQVKIYDPTSLVFSPGISLPHYRLTQRQALAWELNQRGLDAHTSESSIEYFSRALDIDPNNPLAWVNRSAEFLKWENWENSLRDAQRAYQLAPQNPFIINNLAKALVYNKRPHESLKLSQGLIQNNPNFAMAYLSRAYAYDFLAQEKIKKKGAEKNKYLKLAEKDYVQFVKMAPDAVEEIVKHSAKALEAAYQQSPVELRRKYENETHDFNPVQTLAMLNLANLYWKAGHRERALNLAMPILIGFVTRRMELKKQGEDFSAEVHQILQDYRTQLGSLSDDPKIKPLWNDLEFSKSEEKPKQEKR